MPRKGSPPRLRFPATDAFDEVLSKSAFARFLKCDPSRITQMIKGGTIAPPAVTDTGDILPALALAQMQEAGCFAPQAGATSSAAAPGKTVAVSNETYDQARIRLASGQADAQEMTNRKRRSQLVEAVEVGSLIESGCRRLTTRLLALPSSYAAALARLKTPQEAHDFLYALIVEALTELSEGFAKWTGEPEPGDGTEKPT